MRADSQAKLNFLFQFLVDDGMQMNVIFSHFAARNWMDVDCGCF